MSLRKWALMIFLVVFYLLQALPPIAYAQENYAILVLHSYHQGLSWTEGITAGILQGIEPATRKGSVFFEYLDAKRYSLEILEPTLYALFKEKYPIGSLDAVIIADNDALYFVAKYREELFPDTPLIFTGINHFSPFLLDDPFFYTGSVVETSPELTLELMKRLHPKAQSVYVITDFTRTGEAERDRVQAMLHRNTFPFRVLCWHGLSLEQLYQNLDKLNPEEDLVLLIAYNRDPKGGSYTYEESATLLAWRSKVPIYAVADFHMGYGVVGGVMVSSRHQGEVAGEYALRVLQGEPISSLPIQMDSPKTMQVDYRAMRRFGIDTMQLPFEAVIRFAPAHWIEEEWSALFSYELFQSHGAIMMLINPQDGEIVGFNRSALEFYGYTQEELLGLEIDAINLYSKEQVQEEMMRAKKQERNFFRFRHKLATGEIRDVEVYSYPVEVSNQSLLFSIIHDVTGRIQAEEALTKGRLRFVQSLLGGIFFLCLVIGVLFYINCKRLQGKRVLEETNAKLSYLASHDSMTGLLNRREFEKRVQQEVSNSGEECASIVVVDIDHFKNINDAYGHPAGDALLVEFSAILQRVLGEKDLVARWGGEEFILLFPHTSAKGGMDRAEAIRKTIEGTTFVIAGNEVRVTASFGLAEFALSDSESLVTAYQRADNALYKAKNNGRNQCILEV